MFFMNNNEALKITVGVESGFLENQYEIIEDDRFILDNSEEKRNHIKTLLTTTELDLTEVLKQEKSKISHVKIKFPDGKIATLQEIYDSE